MSIFSRFKLKSLPFSRNGSHAWRSTSAYFDTSLPGSRYDYHSAAGVLWQNTAAAACFVALTKAFAQARPMLEQREDKLWKPIEEHPLVNLLNCPNAFYSGEKLFGVTLVCSLSHGSAFWRIERDVKGDPSEIWFEPPVGVGFTGISPNWDTEEFISDYGYYVDGRKWEVPLAREDVVYFRHGLNPSNSRLPWSPLSLAAREIATLNGAATYTGALLRHSAVPSGILSLDGTEASGSALPTPEQAEEMKRKLREGFTGESVGEPFISSLPWKWTPFNWSPAELSIDKLRQWPQGVVCALLGTPEIVAGLPTGEQPTYQNLESSMRWWWDNTIIPLEDAFADEIETQLFPAFGLEGSEWRISWDRSKVAALRDDEKAKMSMWLEAYKAGVCDRATVKARIGLEVEDSDEDIYYGGTSPEKKPGYDDGELKYDPNQPRDNSGKWARYGTRLAGSKKSRPKKKRKNANRPLIDREVQRYCEEHNEAYLATKVGGTALPDSEPMDIVVFGKKGLIHHGIELKTMLFNKRGYIRMKASAVARKAEWEKLHGASVHTLVFDDSNVKDAKGKGKHDLSNRIIYYRRGYGSASVHDMHKVENMRELLRLINTPDEDLPAAAKRRNKP